MSGRIPVGRRAVGRVHQQARVALAQLAGEGLKAFELGGEVVVAGLVRGGEVRHQPGEHEPLVLRGRGGDGARLLRVARAEPAHPGVELDVDARRTAAGRRALGQRVDEALLPGHDVRVGLQRRARVLRRKRPHHEDRPGDSVAAEVLGLGRRGDAEPACAAGDRSPRRPDGAVPVAVRLDHGAQLRVARQERAEVGAVALDRPDVDPRQRPLGGHSEASAPSTSTRVTTPTSRPSSTTGSRLWPDS